MKETAECSCFAPEAPQEPRKPRKSSETSARAPNTGMIHVKPNVRANASRTIHCHCLAPSFSGLQHNDSMISPEASGSGQQWHGSSRKRKASHLEEAPGTEALLPGPVDTEQAFAWPTDLIDSVSAGPGGAERRCRMTALSTYTEWHLTADFSGYDCPRESLRCGANALQAHCV